MTSRLYEKKPYLREFVTEVLGYADYSEDKQGVVLKDTLFFPEGGGQPGDRGFIDSVPVLDTQEVAGEILHIVEELPKLGAVTITLDWSHRFDFMQQHTAQHLLSALMWKVHGGATKAVHFGEQFSTIDFDLQGFSAQQTEDMEERFLQLVGENREIRLRHALHKEIPALQLRRAPQKELDNYRLVEIADFDLATCCGIHLTSTAQLGLLKILRCEVRKGGIRLYWLAGKRALSHYFHCYQILDELGTKFSKPPEQIMEAINNFEAKYENLRTQEIQQRNEWSKITGEQLVEKGCKIGAVNLVVAQLPSVYAAVLDDLATQLAETKNQLVLLAVREESGVAFQLACHLESANFFRLGELFAVIQERHQIKGGGRNHHFRGRGANIERFSETIQQTKKWLKEIQ